MNIRYKSDLYASHIQVRIPEEKDRKQYAFQMLEKNTIPGVLEAEERIEEGEAWLYLDVTGKISLQQEFKDREMELEEMTDIFRQLIAVFEELRNYLLTDRFILAEPEFIYRDLETEKLSVAVLPWERKEEQGLRKLAEFFLEKMNPKDENGINTAYLFYKQQSNPNFSLYRFLPAMERENILKRQKKKEKEKGDFGEAAAINFSEERALWDEEIIPEREGKKKKKKGFFSWLFSRKKEINPEYDLSADADIGNDEINELSGCPETVFFEEYKEEWALQWKEKGRTRTAPLKELPLTVGKLKGEVSVIMEHSSVSRIHCRFLEHDGGIGVMDMNSTNGTWLNGMRLKSGEILGIAKNDEIRVGKVRIFVV
ncbi:MAG: FHA domain-containing protein [Lachnospiraceae bacterium]|nr:FHA domain-containing protein [Lachnospiraceae bacterium]